MRCYVAPLALLLLAVPGCKDKNESTGPVRVELHASGGNHGGHSGWAMRTDLSGGEELPVARTTPASGFATFRLSGDGTTITYELEVEDISNVTQAHIHQLNPATPGTGGIVVWLYGLVPSNLGAQPDGRLASGQFTPAQFVGALAGVSMDEFMRRLRAGQLYVNVHTNDGDATPNEGPGDFPGGEIRGGLGDK